jgi:hypothetical protein
MLQSISPPEHPLGIPSERPLSDIELGPRNHFFELINAALVRQCHRREAAAFDFAHRLWLVGDRRGLARRRRASRRCHSYPDSGRGRNDDPRRNDTHDTWPYETHPVRKSRHRLDQYFWSARGLLYGWRQHLKPSGPCRVSSRQHASGFPDSASFS